MRIGTWNINSVAARLPLVTRWLSESKPDVLCLQEIKCTNDKFPLATFEELGYQALVHGQKTYNGVAILARAEPLDPGYGFPGDSAEAQSRLVAATISGIRIINVYIPNGSFVGSDKYEYKLAWIRRLREYLDNEYEPDEPLLLCGDFNVAPEDRDVHDPDLWNEKVLCSTPEREAIERVREWGFEDSFRLHHDEPGFYSWWDYRAASFRRNAGLRIDHVWISGTLAPRCRSAWIDKETRSWERPSDHAPVVAEFDA